MMMVSGRKACPLGCQVLGVLLNIGSFRSCATRRRCLQLFSSHDALAVAVAVKSLCDVML